MDSVVNKLKLSNKTISVMESCTGGYISNSITNISGSSDVFKFGTVTYSNEFKIKMGVSKSVIDKYSVYSMETANEMSKEISYFTKSNYGIGVTGKLNCSDEYNLYGDDNKVFISIYNRDIDKFYNDFIIVSSNDRIINKEMVLLKIKEMLKEII